MKRTNRASAFPWQRAALMVLCVLLALVLFVLLFATAYIQYLLSLVTDDGSNWNVNAQEISMVIDDAAFLDFRQH